jgi:hypothetical protein
MTSQPAEGPSKRRCRNNRKFKSGMQAAKLGERDESNGGKVASFIKALARFSGEATQEGDRQYTKVLPTVSAIRRIKSVRNHWESSGGDTVWTMMASVVVRKLGRSPMDSRVSVKDLSSLWKSVS